MLGFLFKVLGGGPDSGLFGYLRSRDSNRTQRMIEQGRNETEIQIRKDWYRAQIQLERERRTTARELIDHLPAGSEYREGTVVDNREIRKAQAPPVTLLLPNTSLEPRKTAFAQTDLTVPQARAIDTKNGPEPLQNYASDGIDQSRE